MLPTTLANQELEPIFIVIYSVGEQSNVEFLSNNLGFSIQDCTQHDGLAYLDLDQRTTVAFVSDPTADASLLDSCDGVIFVLDAATGVSARAVKIWQLLADLEIPRHIVTTNLFETHTDFDELVAISRRIFSEDLLVRYLPMANDEETAVVALYDLLQNQILDYSTGECVPTSPDLEHIELTSDQRDSLFERLAYLGLADDAFEMYQAGITPAISEFEQAWAKDISLTISPLDGKAGQQVLHDWISRLQNRWNPIIESDEHQTHTSAPNFYGIGIVSGLARYWGNAETEIAVTDLNGETETALDTKMFSSCILAGNISIGDTLHEQGRSLRLVAPVFD